MIWAVLVLVGVPLWLIAIALIIMLRRTSALKARPGNMKMRWRRPDSDRWVLGNAVWVHDVLAFRSRPAAWVEELEWVKGVEVREASNEKAKGLRGLGDEVVIATLRLEGDSSTEVAVAGKDRAALLAPFSTARPA
jgi:hypothetical protein